MTAEMGVNDDYRTEDDILKAIEDARIEREEQLAEVMDGLFRFQGS